MPVGVLLLLQLPLPLLNGSEARYIRLTGPCFLRTQAKPSVHSAFMWYGQHECFMMCCTSSCRYTIPSLLMSPWLTAESDLCSGLHHCKLRPASATTGLTPGASCVGAPCLTLTQSNQAAFLKAHLQQAFSVHPSPRFSPPTCYANNQWAHL